MIRIGKSINRIKTVKFCFQGTISFLEFSEAMDRAREAQEGATTGDSEVIIATGVEHAETSMEVSDTAKDESNKPSSKSNLTL